MTAYPKVRIDDYHGFEAALTPTNELRVVEPMRLAGPYHRQYRNLGRNRHVRVRM